MSLIAILVEGLTETIYFNHLILPTLQLPDKLFFSTSLIKVLDDTIHENKIWVQDCRGDKSILTFIKKNVKVFFCNDFDNLILVRDFHPDNRPPSQLCKKELCQRILSGIPQAVTQKYPNNIFINLSVEAVEAWFFVDKKVFQKIAPILTEEFINTNCNNILDENPEYYHSPSNKFVEIVRMAIPNYRYRKHESEIYSIVSKIDKSSWLNFINENRLQSLNRIINYLLEN